MSKGGVKKRERKKERENVKPRVKKRREKGERVGGESTSILLEEWDDEVLSKGEWWRATTSLCDKAGNGQSALGA